jgi:pimeloyl-ACP methyl ester carboxylesterase
MWITKEVISDDHLSKIKSKFLIVYGDRDVTKLEHGLHIYRTIKGSQLAILPNTTHHTFAEKPALISNLMIDFLGN